MSARVTSLLAAVSAIVELTFAGVGNAQTEIPLRSVGPATAVTAEPLGLLLGVRSLSDGGLIVDDGGGRRLLRYNASLKAPKVLADTSGTGGFAYGDVASPIIPWLGDSTLFLDRAARALVVLDAAGQQRRLAALPKQTDLIWIGGSKTLSDPMGRLVYRGGPVGNPSRDTGQAIIVNRLPDSAVVIRANFDTRTTDTVGRVKLPTLQENHRVRQPDGSFRTKVLLFGLSWQDDWTMTSDGTIAILRGQDYHIDWITKDGARSSTPKMAYNWQALSDDEQHRIADSAARETQTFIDKVRNGPLPPPRPDGSPGIRIAARADLGTGALQVMPIDARAEAAPLDRIPDYQAPFRPGMMLADRDGNVWIVPAAVTSRAGGLVYDVANRKGEIIERIELPAGRSIAEFGPGGTLYLMYKDGAVWRLEVRRVVR